MRRFFSKRVPFALAASLVLAACEQAGPTAPPATPGQALLSAQGSGQAPAPRGYTTQDRYSLDGDLFYNECTDEDVRLSGEVHTVWHVSPNGNGGYRLVNKANAVGLAGVGVTSGIRYVGAQNLSFSTDLTAGSEATVVFTLRFVGRGSADDWFLTSTSRVRVDADGMLTYLRDRTSIVCR